MERLLFCLMCVSLAVIYFLPWIVAGARKHPNRVPIFILNLFLGATLVGWAVALAWACMAIQRPPVQASPASRPLDDRDPTIAALDRMASSPPPGRN